jgi:type III secretion protein Q
VPLPFELPRISRGFAALSPAACAAGTRALAAAAAALTDVAGRNVSLRARPLPGTASPRPGALRVAVDLGAVPTMATLELDPAIVIALVDALAGGSGTESAGTGLTPVEAAALELFALAALDGACSVPEIERALAPRLSRGTAEPASPLAIELEVATGEIAGRGRLLVSCGALAALRERGAAGADSASPVRISVSVRSGRATLAPGDLEALSPGDVVVLDARVERSDALVLQGGSRFTGRLDAGGFEVDEVTMTERSSLLPVTLEVELARVEVALSDLARLEPGSVLPLAVDRRGLVTLRAGERAVARGELVDVEGAIGVRILAMEDRS